MNFDAEHVSCDCPHITKPVRRGTAFHENGAIGGFWFIVGPQASDGRWPTVFWLASMGFVAATQSHTRIHLAPMNTKYHVIYEGENA